MITVTTESFDEDVLKSDRPVLVDFWTEWCPPCRMLAPILDEIDAEYGDRLVIAKLNADEHPEVAMRYNVLGYPTLNLYRNGEIVQQIKGAKPKRMILADLAPHI
ncbi:thioredoxin-1 [Acrocarpospora phusangensis]|uniref:Thioredoxin n=1 Tax=Acrocarpospora phusangensis TaxID=1070424 RepID=A0A919QIK4_9ACTN|nr:thioredoxin [Acrocarpospora phusangensis]GIH28689.1 thioredoxin-1 [Acrocarpospora phusangensis]